jgi:site-specific DNA-cytosine methylase
LNNPKSEYDADSFHKLREADRQLVKLLRQGQGIYDVDENSLPEIYKEAWNRRVSNIPFGLHRVRRLHSDRSCPVIFSSSLNYVHPVFDRPLTVREMALLMGWPEDITPVGEHPVGQIGKGIVPAVGSWLAAQMRLSIEGAWGDDDFESTYDHKKRRWTGETDTSSRVEKVFNLLQYRPREVRTCIPA